VLTLVLAGVGLYGVLAYGVAQRTREIGLRMALGAPVRAVLNLVVGQGVRLAVVGCALGASAPWCSRGSSQASFTASTRTIGWCSGQLRWRC
jgi:predicted lysophospholipase L1 biosynthesis ABC-type transport system permease subunit